MNNKSSLQGVSAFVGGSIHPQQSNSPSPPPSTLCFRTSPNIINKQRHRHHYHDPYHHGGLCGCQRVSKSHCVSAFGKYHNRNIFYSVNQIFSIS